MSNSHSFDCLLCGSSKVRVADSLTGSQLRSLWKTSGHQLSDHAMGLITREFIVAVHHCDSCGFEFYDPNLAGSAEFYEELMRERAYPSESAEFSFALEFAKQKGLSRVLDVGGGEGAFLDRARDAGMDTSGVELNRIAAETAARKGHRMFNKAMEEITLAELDGGAEMLTLFQVVEHVPSPVAFVKDAARLVRPGGYLVIGVPSQRRLVGLLPLDPLDWPPHHVSRWREQDLAQLAERAGLTLVKQGHDVLYGRAISWAWNLHNQLTMALGRPLLPGGTWLPKFLASAYRKLGCKYYLGLHGLSIYAIMKKSV